MSTKLTIPVAAVSALVVLAPAAHAMPMGGAFTGRVDGQTPQMIPPDTMKIQQTASGSNAGPGTPLDGAKVTWSESIKLKNGQGTHQGVITFTTPSGSTSSPYRGVVATDAQGRVTAKGRFTSTKGTGGLAGLSGSGGYTAAYSSKTDFTGQWNGDFKMPGQKTSRR